MSGEILNLALKKEIFEGLLDGSLNEIPIKKSNWWKKRLMDENTGRFKDFMVVAATSGSSDKVYFEIKYIELREDNFIIGVKLINMDEGNSDGDIDTNLDNGEVITPEVINPEVIEPVKINPVTIETDESGNTIAKMIVNVKMKHCVYSCSCNLFSRMLQSHFQNFLHMFIIQRIKDTFSFSPALDQFCLTKRCELMAHHTLPQR